MRIFKALKKNKSEEIKIDVIQKESLYKSFLFVIGAFLSALSFNLFYVPNDFVSGGLGGISVIINQLICVNPSFVILVGNLIFIISSIITIGFRESLYSIIGAITYTIFVYLTADIPSLINFSFDNILLYVLAAGVVCGFAEGLVYKSGFNTGGTSILVKIIQKYKKKPTGQLLRIISYIIILAGGIVFGYTAIMYSIIITTISTYMVDRIVIGISDSKTFFIQTDKEDDVKNFIFDVIASGVTEFEVHGGYSNKRKKLIMCVVPSEKYMFLQSALKEIDPDAFIVVSDCYEVVGGTKRKKLSFD